MTDFALLQEAERRGILPPDQKALLDEARRRGLMPEGAPRMADEAYGPEAPDPKRLAAENQVAEDRKSANVVTDTLRNVARGIPVLGGLADEMEAGLRSGIHTVTGGALGAPYDETLEYQRAYDRALDAERPVSGTVAKLAGGLAVAPVLPAVQGATFLGRVAAGGATGAGYGAAHGFTEGEGGVENRLKTAGDYAKGGAVIGTALRTAGAIVNATAQGARQISPWLAARLPGRNAETVADQVLAQRLRRSGQTPTGVRRDLEAGQEAARFNANSRAALPETLADTSDTMQRLTGAVYRQGGEAGETVRRSLETRQRGADNPYSRLSGGDRGQRGQVEDALERALRISTSPTARTSELSIMQNQAREGRRLYQEAYDNADAFDIGPVMQAMGLTRQQYTGGFRAALDKAAGLFEAPSWRPISNANQNFFNMDVRRFDAAKKQLDDMIEGAQRGGENNLARELTLFKNALLERVHEGGRNARYQAARQAWGSAAENREAIELGRQALRDGSEVTLEQFNALTPGQQVLFRQGFLESARNALGRKRPGNDATLLFQEGRVQDLLRAVIPNTGNRGAVFGDRSGRFGEYVNRQARMGSTRQKVLGNSMTEQRRMDDAEFAADAFSRMVMGIRGGANVVLELAGSVLQKATGYRQDVALSLARRLMEADPQRQREILGRLRLQMGPQRFERFVNDMASRTAIAAESTGSEAEGSQTEREARGPVMGAIEGAFGPVADLVDAASLNTLSGADDVYQATEGGDYGGAAIAAFSFLPALRGAKGVKKLADEIADLEKQHVAKFGQLRPRPQPVKGTPQADIDKDDAAYAERLRRELGAADAPPIQGGSSVPLVRSGRPPATTPEVEVLRNIERNPYSQPIPGRQGIPSKQEQLELAKKALKSGESVPVAPWGRNVPEDTKYLVSKGAEITKKEAEAVKAAAKAAEATKTLQKNLVNLQRQIAAKEDALQAADPWKKRQIASEIEQLKIVSDKLIAKLGRR